MLISSSSTDGEKQVWEGCSSFYYLAQNIKCTLNIFLDKQSRDGMTDKFKVGFIINVTRNFLVLFGYVPLNVLFLSRSSCRKHFSIYFSQVDSVSYDREVESVMLTQ